MLDNKAHNVIPARARAQFNVRYNNFHNGSIHLRKKIKLVIKSNCMQNK